jgi:hypothetical protein
MKIAICYKGVFNINYIRRIGVNDNLLNTFSNTMINHRKMLNDDLKENEVDTFFSTYNTDKKLDTLFIKELSPKNFVFDNQNNMGVNSFVAQLYQYKNLIELIREEEKKTKEEYDTIIFTRPDIFFYKNFNSLNISFDKFNIVVEHASKNCDDNLWVFPRKNLDIFENSINDLLTENKMTHELNHKLIKYGVEIQYMETAIDTYMGHTIFSFIR